MKNQPSVVFNTGGFFLGLVGITKKGTSAPLGDSLYGATAYFPCVIFELAGFVFPSVGLPVVLEIPQRTVCLAIIPQATSP